MFCIVIDNFNSFLLTTDIDFAMCAGFDWHRINFLHGSQYQSMFCICAENSVDDTGVFSLLLSSAYTESRPFLLLTCPVSERAGGAQGAGRRHNQDG